jgi:hypothetical protein
MRCLALWGLRLSDELLCSTKHNRRTKAAAVRATFVDGHVEGVTLSLVRDEPSVTPPLVVDREAFLRP